MKVVMVLVVVASVAAVYGDLVCGSDYCKKNPCPSGTASTSSCRSPAVYRANHSGKCACCPACVTLLGFVVTGYLTFQQDGTPAHNSHRTRDYLNKHFCDTLDRNKWTNKMAAEIPRPLRFARPHLLHSIQMKRSLTC